MALFHCHFKVICKIQNLQIASSLGSCARVNAHVLLLRLFTTRSRPYVRVRVRTTYSFTWFTAAMHTMLPPPLPNRQPPPPPPPPPQLRPHAALFSLSVCQQLPVGFINVKMTDQIPGGNSGNALFSSDRRAVRLNSCTIYFF